MEKEQQLAKYYQETKESLTEQRRVIDYEMRNVLAELKKNHSTEGSLRVLRYKSEIQQAEVAYNDRAAELKDIDTELRPILIEINATKNDPFSIQVDERSFFDVYINEDLQIIASTTYTKIS